MGPEDYLTVITGCYVTFCKMRKISENSQNAKNSEIQIQMILAIPSRMA